MVQEPITGAYHQVFFTIFLETTMIRVPIDDDRSFNNPDGFAMVFDRRWKELDSLENFKTLSIDARIEKVFQTMGEHPFLQSAPEQARQIATFRVRLLNLGAPNTSS